MEALLNPIPRLPTMLCASLTLLGVMAPADTLAALGDDLKSVEADRVAMKGSVQQLTDLRFGVSRYVVHEIQTPEGTVVREYVAPSGKVFAVTWQGNFLPNLQQLLGASFEPWQSAVRAQRRGRSAVSVATARLVVHSGGHMRAFFGQAYLPQDVPADVPLSELR